jgi:hypothetical protein
MRAGKQDVWGAQFVLVSVWLRFNGLNKNCKCFENNSFTRRSVGSLTSYSRQLQMAVAVIRIQVLRSAAWTYSSQSIPPWTPLLEVGFYLRCYGVRKSTWNLFWASKHFHHFYVQRTCSRERKFDKISSRNGFNVAKTVANWCRWLSQDNVKLWHMDLPSFTGMTHLLHKLSQEFIDCQLSSGCESLI